MGSVSRNGDDLSLPLTGGGGEESEKGLKRRVWIESKKLWHVAGPSIFSRITSFSMNIVTAAFAGHLGDLELASISIGNTVIVGFSFGLLVYNRFIKLPRLCFFFSSS